MTLHESPVRPHFEVQFPPGAGSRQECPLQPSLCVHRCGHVQACQRAWGTADTLSHAGERSVCELARTHHLSTGMCLCGTRCTWVPTGEGIRVSGGAF